MSKTTALKPILQLKRKPKTLVQLYSSPKRWVKGWFFSSIEPIDHRVEYIENNEVKNPDTAVACCIQGAIAIVDNINFNNVYPHNKKLLKIANVLGFKNVHEVIEWNNRSETTFKEFISVLKKAGV